GVLFVVEPGIVLPLTAVGAVHLFHCEVPLGATQSVGDKVQKYSAGVGVEETCIHGEKQGVHKVAGNKHAERFAVSGSFKGKPAFVEAKCTLSHNVAYRLVGNVAVLWHSAYLYMCLHAKIA